VVTVLIYGSDSDTLVADALLAFCRALGASAVCVDAESVRSVPSDPGECDFLIIDGAGKRKIDISGGIAVFKSATSGNGLWTNAAARLPAGFTAVVEPDNVGAVGIIKALRLRTITCGLSQADTLTFSSIDTASAVISLQRAVRSLYGGTILPRDIPVSFVKEFGCYPLLAAAAVMLLCEMPFPDGGVEF
jgi:hypothetical protein